MQGLGLMGIILNYNVQFSPCRTFSILWREAQNAELICASGSVSGKGMRIRSQEVRVGPSCPLNFNSPLVTGPSGPYFCA